MQDKSKGFLIFAQNNSTVNYLKIALANALLIKKYLDKPVTVITDKVSLGWPENKENAKLIESAFDEIILREKDPTFVNTRSYRDTIYHSVLDNFNNQTRASAYQLSPYDETILIDADYLVFDKTLNTVWESMEDVMINKDAIDLNGNQLLGTEYRISDTGVRMYWATCIYFKKCEKAQLLFDTVEHIRDHWDYYRMLYDFSTPIFRNDFAFSIAIHMLNGFVENDTFKPLPVEKILTVLDSDQVYKYHGNGEISLFVHNKIENWKFEVSRVKGVSTHILNKLSLMPELDAIIEDCL